MSDGVWQWMALVCGLFGSLVGLFQATDSVSGFSKIALKIATNKKRSLIWTFILGIIVFVDEWLNALIVGHAMRSVTDTYRVPRVLLAYIIQATGTIVCIIVPFSTWSAFFAGQLEGNGVALPGTGTATYITTIPYLFYPIAAFIVALLITVGILPLWGPMKKAAQRAEENGLLFPEGIEVPENMEVNKQALATEPDGIEIQENMESNNQTFATENKDKRDLGALNFIIPLVVLALITIITAEMLYGVIGALLCCMVLYFPQKLLSIDKFCEAMLVGFKDMLGVIGIVYAAFILRNFNDQLGLAPYVIGIVENSSSSELLPAASFVVVSALVFAAGNFWGMAAISFPVIIPLGQALGANMFLMSSAVICATAFAANACFYGSEVTLTCSATQIRNIDYAKTSLPIIAVPYVIAVIAFIIAGYLL